MNTAETASARQSRIDAAHKTLQSLVDAIGNVIRGRDDTVRLVLTALAANGHVLIEDYPGSGKTTLAKTLGQLINCENTDTEDILPFRRIQFTPDLLPADVLGVNIFEPKAASFRFQHGPIFAHVVLADEINRTGPKVQAAFLECMAERQVTIDNVTYPLDDLFFVIGTQNPLDMAGTYPLPMVQLDRFLLKVPMRYVTPNVELEILQQSEAIDTAVREVRTVVTREEILATHRAVSDVHLNPQLLQAIVDIVQASRSNPALQFGASTRAAIMLKRSLGAWALAAGRDFATDDDLKTLAKPVLQHRLRFHPGSGDPEKAFMNLIAPHLEKVVTKAWA